MKLTKKVVATALAMFVVVTIALNLIYSYTYKGIIENEKTRYHYIAANEADQIKSCLDKVIVRTYTLREMIVENKGGLDFFDEVAPIIYNTVKDDTGVSLRNVAVAPDGIVEKVYPLETNESLVGFNFTDTSQAGNAEAMEAYLKGETIVTNPFTLTQGGIGMAARTPVYVDADGDGETEFWGLVTATMDFDEMLSAFDFASMRNIQIDYRLWYENSDGEDVVLDQSGDDFSDAVSVSFDIYNLTWNLDIIPTTGWYDHKMEVIARVAMVLGALLLTFLLMAVEKIRVDGKKMKNMAERDGLTQCYSRYYVKSVMLADDGDNWRSDDVTYSVAIVDVDKFKEINDTYGHIAGDKALIAIADILKNNVDYSKGDSVVRYGGDEFLIFFNNIRRDQIEDRVKRILRHVSETTVDGNKDMKLSISVGIAYNDRNDPVGYKKLMRIADANLYAVKESGRNNYKL